MRAAAHRMGARPRPHRIRRSRAFSLIEMLFVVIIIGLIAALVVPNLGKAFGKSQVKTTTAQLANLSDAVENFRLDVNRYPTEQEGLQALIEKPETAEGWAGPYLDKRTLPTDGWGNEFIYKRDPDFGFIIISHGADGVQGGSGENADLDNRS